MSALREHASGLSGREQFSRLGTLSRTDDQTWKEVQGFWASIPVTKRKEALASVFIESFLKDLFSGRIDLLLHQLYTTNHSNSPVIRDLTATFKYIFRLLVYSRIKLCVRSDGSFSLFDAGDNPWWITRDVMSPQTRLFLTQLRRPEYKSFARTCEQISGMASVSTVWSEFEYDYVISNAFLTKRSMDGERSLSSLPIQSPRGHLCERMIYLIALSNIGFAKPRQLSPTQPSFARHVFQMSVSYVWAALQQLPLERCLGPDCYEYPPEESMPVPAIVGLLDNPVSIHQHLNTLLEDQPRLLAITNKFGAQFQSHMSAKPAPIAAQAEPLGPGRIEHAPQTDSEAE